MKLEIIQWLSNHEIMVGVSAIIMIFIISIRQKIVDFIIDKLWFSIKKLCKNSYFLNKQQIIKDRQIHDMLVELRTRTNSDRTSVYQFHNGIIFSSNISGWRISCTFESVASGIVSEAGNFQNIISSCLINIISCLWDNDNLQHGIKKISPDYCTCSNIKACKLPKGVFLINVNDLLEGYAKSFLLKQGIVKMIISPLLYIDNRIGILGVSYCNDVKDEDIMEHCETICRQAHLISYTMKS